jgi:CheY-specific phosphatase CheX
MNIDEEIITKLAQRTESYLKNDLGISDIRYIDKIQVVEDIHYNDISSLISLGGDLNGTVGMSVSKEFAYTLVEQFLSDSIEKDELMGLCIENIAETLNITLGNILKDLSVTKNGGKVEISTPYTLENKVCIKKKKDGRMSFCELKVNNETIIISYFI